MKNEIDVALWCQRSLLLGIFVGVIASGIGFVLLSKIH